MVNTLCLYQVRLSWNGRIAVAGYESHFAIFILPKNFLFEYQRSINEAAVASTSTLAPWVWAIPKKSYIPQSTTFVI